MIQDFTGKVLGYSSNQSSFETQATATPQESSMTAQIVTDRIAMPNYRPSFSDWRRHLDRERIPPVIAVAGSRGKTSVIRAVESIFRSGTLRFASWTNRGVEIEGERQRGELGPWSRTMTRLRSGGLDVALQELDWATLQTIGTPVDVYPVVAVSNLCGNSDACLATPETLLARKALSRLKSSVSQSGKFIVNANDVDLSGDAATGAADHTLVGVSPDAPLLRRHLLQGGDACFVDDSMIVVIESGEVTPIVRLSDLPWVREGGIPFSVQNALMATAIARACGISAGAIASGLTNHAAQPESMPGSFNLFDTDKGTIVIDRPMPSWFLRTSLRAAGNLGIGRPIRAVGPMENVSVSDLTEVGRLLGRQGGVILAHGDWDAERLTIFRQGAAANEVPPLFVQVRDERLAIQQAIDMIKPGDILFILAEDAPAVVRLISSRVRRGLLPLRSVVGAA